MVSGARGRRKRFPSRSAMSRVRPSASASASACCASWPAARTLRRTLVSSTKVTTVNKASSQSTATRTNPSAGRGSNGALAGGRTLSPSAHGTIDVAIELAAARLAAWSFQVEARAVFVGGAGCLFGVPQRARANDDQQLGAVNAIVLGTKGGAEHRDVAQER